MNIARFATALLATLILTFTACEKRTVVVVEPPAPDPVSQTKTLETHALKAAIDSYEQAPTNERAAEVRKSFADLDSEIAELEARVARKDGDERAEAAQKLANLIAYRNAETARFTKAQATSTSDHRIDPRSGAEKVEDAARRTGEALKDAAKETGDAIKDAVR